ncbi:MAG: hypothetical protein MK207_02885 [Saprospiraceae bacterium]|nr:hypothetical protein [Saprospiraceae bacterium]
MKNLLIVLMSILLIGCGDSLNAQNYNTSVGGRIGPSYGFTLKHFMSQRLAVEGLITSRYLGPYRTGFFWPAYRFGNGALGVNFSVLVEYHFPIARIEGFNWFIGGGAHVGIWAGETGHPWFPNSDRAYFLTGVDLVGGVEYTFSKIPLTLQADIKPSVHFIEYLGVWYDEIAVSARYTF